MGTVAGSFRMDQHDIIEIKDTSTIQIHVGNKYHPCRQGQRYNIQVKSYYGKMWGIMEHHGTIQRNDS